jgi:colanic acid biosynthesis glycosyl transferase WcaI
VVLSEGFRYTLIKEKEVPAEKITVIPVWLDAQDIVPKPRDNLWRREMGIGAEKFVVLYAGTIGLVSGAEMVVEAAKNLQSYEDILFLFVGWGQSRDRVEAEARKAGLRNMRFLPFQPRERLSEVQATADISLVTLAPGRGKTSVPSKVLGYMAAGRPVLAAVDAACDTAALIKRAECGVAVLPGNAKVISEEILNLFKNPQWRQDSGLKGRKYFEENFERSKVLGRFLDLIVEVHEGAISES